MMKLSLLINPVHAWQDSLHHAWLLASAACGRDTLINTVFFYGDSVQLVRSPELQSPWLELQQQSGTRLLLCRTMLEHFDLTATDAPGFDVVGMASLTSAMEQSDRTLEVG